MRTVIALTLIALLAVSTTSYAAKTAGQDNGPEAEDGIRDRSPSRGLGDVYKRQMLPCPTIHPQPNGWF